MKFKLHICILIATTLQGCMALDNMVNIDTATTPPDLVVITTNDIHSNIDQIPKLASLTKRQREEHKNVILLDAGDRQTGNAFVDYAKQPGSPIIEMMNMLGYNTATLGEHEFAYGQHQLAKNIELADFDVVCANIRNNDILPEFEPYRYIEIGKKRIAVMGLINIDKNSRQPPALATNLENLAFEDPVVVAKQYKSLTSRVDMFILLSHCGTYTDSVISSNVPQINLIVGGGSHEPIFNRKEINGVLLTQAGSGLKYAGITKVWFGNKNQIRCENMLVDLDTYKDDEEFKIILNKIKSENDFNKIIGQNNDDMDKTGIASLLCNSMMKSSDCRYAIYDMRHINQDFQPKGAFTLENLYNIEPYKYRFCNLYLSIGAIENIIREEYNLSGKKDGKKPLHIEGMKYELQTDKAGNITNVVFINNSNIISNSSMEIKIAVNEYIFMTYKHLTNNNSGYISTVTNSVIDYYL